jgi:hypothetical protein
VLVHDRDRNFARSFKDAFVLESARVVLTPLMAPKANAHAERWVGSARRECLDWMLFVSQHHLEAVLSEYSSTTTMSVLTAAVAFDLLRLGARQIGWPGVTIRKRAGLGGLLNEYSDWIQAGGSPRSPPGRPFRPTAIQTAAIAPVRRDESVTVRRGLATRARDAVVSPPDFHEKRAVALAICELTAGSRDDLADAQVSATRPPASTPLTMPWRRSMRTICPVEGTGTGSGGLSSSARCGRAWL